MYLEKFIKINLLYVPLVLYWIYSKFIASKMKLDYAFLIKKKISINQHKLKSINVWNLKIL